MKTMKYYAVAAVASILMIGISKSAHADWKTNAEVEANRGLPRMVNNEIMATRVQVDERGPTYYMKMVRYPAAAINQTFLNNSKQGSAQQWCASKDRSRLDQGMTITYVISGSDDAVAGSYVISKSSCQ